MPQYIAFEYGGDGHLLGLAAQITTTKNIYNDYLVAEGTWLYSGCNGGSQDQ